MGFWHSNLNPRGEGSRTGTILYLGCGVVLAVAVLRRVDGVPVITPHRAAPRRRLGARGTERRRRVGGTCAPGATSAIAQGVAHLQGVRGGGVVAHRRRWDGSPATGSREDKEPTGQREGDEGSWEGERMGVTELVGAGCVFIEGEQGRG